MILGCHNVIFFNQSTLVLGYLLLFGYDVVGEAYKMRLWAIFVGAILTIVVYYRNHRKKNYKRNIIDLLKEQGAIYYRIVNNICGSLFGYLFFTFISHVIHKKNYT